MISEKKRLNIQELVKAACKNGSRKQAACELIGVTIRTLQRWKQSKSRIDARSTVKKNPHNKFSKVERLKILEVANSPKYGHLPPSKIVPMLADEGRYIASESTIYRTLREKKLLSHRLMSRTPSTYKPKALEAKGPNEIYTWDITYLRSDVKGHFFYLYLIMDLFSRKIVGWQVYDRECSYYASDVIEDACAKEGVQSGIITLHSDNGSAMKGATMLATLQRLGVTPSFSRPSVSNDNPYSEALFKTLKYSSNYPVKPFINLQKARLWTSGFVEWYNNKHLHSEIKFVTPAQKHAKLDHGILENRRQVYLKAKSLNPHRWSQNIRNWNSINSVLLNPEKSKKFTSRSKVVA